VSSGDLPFPPAELQREEDVQDTARGTIHLLERASLDPKSHGARRRDAGRVLALRALGMVRTLMFRTTIASSG